MTAQPRIIIIAGPNGAGKTTFAKEFLPREADCPVFINADLIAAGLSPFRPEAQGGHDVAEAVIRRRFNAGLAYFRQVLAPLVNAWQLYDNSGPEPILLEWGEKP